MYLKKDECYKIQIYWKIQEILQNIWGLTIFLSWCREDQNSTLVSCLGFIQRHPLGSERFCIFNRKLRRKKLYKRFQKKSQDWDMVTEMEPVDWSTRPVVITIFTCDVCSSVISSPFLKILRNKFQVRILIATGGIVGLAEWIIDDTNVLYIFLLLSKILEGRNRKSG